MCNVRTLRRLSFAAAAALFARASSAPAQSIAIGSGVQSWIDTAHSGRSDMLILGDSVVWAGANGWDAGVIRGFSNRLGLAGTGLAVNSSSSGEGEGYAVYGDWYGFSTDPNAVPASHRNLIWRGAVTAPSSPIFGFGWGLVQDDPTIDRTAAYDWNLYTVQPAGGGSLGATRRVSDPNNGVTYLQTDPAVALPAAGSQPTKTTFHFDAANPSLSGVHEFQVQNAVNTSILYSRLLKSGATGATVSSWGYGGHNTKQFLQDFWLGGTWDSTGRQALLKNLVDGGSGKLNVLIAEGFNDRNDLTMSVNGVAPGQSGAGYRDNTMALINAVRADWSAAGLSSSNLTFTLLAMYETDANMQALRTFADEARSIAQSDPQIAFVDLFQIAPSLKDSLAAEYLTPDDAIHPTYGGSLAFGDAVVASLVTSPGSIWNLGGNGNWSQAGNWSGSVPNAVGAAAKFAGAGAGSVIVTVDAPQTVGALTFSAASTSYTLAGGATITFDALTTRPAINVTAGTHLIAAPVLLNKDSIITTSAGTGVALTGNVSATGRTIMTGGEGTVAFENVRADGLNILGGTVRISAKGSSNTSAGTSVLRSLSIASGASLDLTNNSAILDYDTPATLPDPTRMMLQDARLISSSADASHKLGYGDNAVLHKGTFGGVSVDDSSLLIMYTYGGDANLDGQVDVTDLGNLATNWQTDAPWTGGDFNYDGFVDVTDLGILATNWQAGVSSPASQLEEALSTVGLSPISIPEPSTFALFGSVAAALVFPRRRS